MKRIIHIAPALPPAVNGLGDFCKILANNLEKDGYTHNLFMVRYSNNNDPDKNILTFEPGTFSDLLNRQKADVVMLHYVGYAYNKRGLPFYILSGLKEYKRRFSSRILVFFHELYASSSSFFKLPFYTNAFQRQIIKQLNSIADNTFTNCTIYNDLLKELVGQNKFKSTCTGIFSNIPDDLYDNKIEKEETCMVVFGSYYKRRVVYENPSFREIIERLGIKSLYDIGPGGINFSHKDLKIFPKGCLHSSVLARYLNKANFGALSYSSQLLAKSGIFSAYAAFGVIPINLLQTDPPSYDGLVEGKNYCSWKSNELLDTVNFDSIREEILSWYKSRSQQAITEKIKIHI